MDSPLDTPVTKDEIHKAGAGMKLAHTLQGLRPLDLKVKIFADGADKASMLEMYADPESWDLPPIPL